MRYSRDADGQRVARRGGGGVVAWVGGVQDDAMPTAIKIFSETELRAPQSISALPIHQRLQKYRTIYQFSSNLPRGVRTASLLPVHGRG